MKSPLNYSISSRVHQSGFSLLVGIFVIVILALLGASMAQLTSVAHMDVTQSARADHALFAAESGAQAQMMRVFPTSGAATCSSASFSFTTPGLQSCQANTTCGQLTVDTVNYYDITSEGICSAGTAAQATRQLQVRARELP